MRDGLQIALALFSLTLIGVACGWWAVIVVPAIIAAAVARDRYPAYRLEVLRLEAQNAQADHDRAVAELEDARADLAAAVAARERARAALRASDWLVVDERVPLN